jgi:hypothetical protein
VIQLTEMPARIAALPKDPRGYPIPWFVDWLDGKPVFPAMDLRKWRRAVKDRLCWVCGEPLGSHLAFVAGPMCGINRTSAEPPSHLDCALFSVRNCPFLMNPNMKRIDNAVTREATCPAGIMQKRNPGVSLIWVTKSYRLFRDPAGGALIHMGDPTQVSAWREGRAATSAELHHSIVSGLAPLVAIADAEDARGELKQHVEVFRSLLYGKFGLELAPIALP